jgi:hypothetical protein
MAQAPPLTVIFHESPGAYRKNGPGLDAARKEAQFTAWNLTTNADHNGTGQQATRADQTSGGAQVSSHKRQPERSL